MRHRVTIQQRSTGTDAAGGVLNTWTTFAERWAAIERTSGSEVWASAQKSARVPTVFWLRYLAGVEPKMRLLCGGSVYEILSAVDQAGMKSELVITAEEFVGEAP